MKSEIINIAKICGSLGTFALSKSLDILDRTGCLSEIVKAITGNLASNYVAKYDPIKLLEYVTDGESSLNHDIEKLMIRCIPKSVELVASKYLQENQYNDIFINKTLKRLFNDAKLLNEDSFDGTLTNVTRELWLEEIHEYIFRGQLDEDGKLEEIKSYYKHHLQSCFELVFLEGLKDKEDEKPLKAFIIKTLDGISKFNSDNIELQNKILHEISLIRETGNSKVIAIAKEQLTIEFERLHQKLNLIYNIVSIANGNIEVILQEVMKLQELLRDKSQTNLVSEPSTEELKTYLEYVIKNNSDITLPGIKEEKQLPKIPLEKIYVSLKVQKNLTKSEIEKGVEFFKKKVEEEVFKLGYQPTLEELHEIEYRIFEKYPLMALYLENSRSKFMYKEFERESEKPIISFAEAFKKERLLMILGGPGSGKSTTIKWIANILAKSFLEQIETGIIANVKVNLLDSSKGNSDESLEDLGPSRVPLVIRVSEYAHKYQKEKISVIEYLNYIYQTISGIKKINAPEYYLSRGKAVVLVDGMDEISVERIEINRELERFIYEWIEKRGTLDNFEDTLLPPVQTGGNQIIVTSRITGYYTYPLNMENITHVTIENMDEQAIQYFCDAWNYQVDYLQNKNKLSIREILDLSKENSKLLQEALFDKKNPNIRILATTPLLITVLAIVFRNDKTLPTNRAELYERITTILVENLRKLSNVSISEIYYILVTIAYSIHKSSGDTISKEELKCVIREAACEYLDKDIDKLTPEDDDRIVKPFVALLQEQVGLLAEDANGVFRFLHRTFQEFLTAIYLVRNRRNSIEQIISHLEDPIWREPIFLALGYISLRSKQIDFNITLNVDELIRELLNNNDPIDDLLPRTALFVAYAIPEMQELSNDIIEEVVYKLIDLYYEKKIKNEYKSLESQLEKVIKNLFDGEKKIVIEQLFRSILRDRDESNLKRISAIAYLIQKNNWMNETFEPLFIKLLNYPIDSGFWGFPIDSALRKYRSLETHTNKYENLSFKRLLTIEHIEKISKDSRWIRLMFCFYGGFKDTKIAANWIELQKLKGNLELNIGNSDERYNYAVRLDTELGVVEKGILEYLEFNPDYIYKDSTLNRQIYLILNSDNDFNFLKDEFIECLEVENSDLIKSEALLGLSLFGREHVEYYIRRDANELYIKLFYEHLKRVEGISKQYFTSFYAYYVHRKNKSLISSFFNDLENEQQRITVLKKLYEITTKFDLPPLDFSYCISEKRIFEIEDEDNAIQVESEAWIQRMCCNQHDVVYNLHVTLDTIPNLLKSDLMFFCKVLANLDKTYNIGSYYFPLRLPVEKFRIEPNGEEEIALKAIQNIQFLPKEFDFLKDWMLWSLNPLYEKYPQLILSAIYISFEISEKQLFSKIVPEIVEYVDVTQILKIYKLKVKKQGSVFIYSVGDNDEFSSDSFLTLTNSSENLAPDKLLLQYDFILSNVPQLLKGSKVNFGQLKSLLMNVTDLHTRINIGCKLARIEPTFMSEVIPIIKMSDDNNFKRKIVTEIIDEFGNNYEYDEILKELYNSTIIEPIEELLNIIDDRLSVEHVNFWSCFSLISLVDDYNHVLSAGTHLESIWHQLIENYNDEKLIEELVSIGIQRRLALSSDIVESITKIIDSGGKKTIDLLLPFLEVSSKKSIHFIEELKDSKIDSLQYIYSLIKAEHGFLDIFILNNLIKLLNSDDDNLRNRAAVALHGENIGGSNDIRRFRLSKVDIDTLIYIEVKRNSTSSKFISSKLAWINHNFFFDDIDKIKEMIHRIDNNDKNQKNLSSIISRIEKIPRLCPSDIHTLLGASTEKTIKSILNAFCRLTYLSSYKFKDDILNNLSIDNINLLNDMKFKNFSFKLIIDLLENGEIDSLEQFRLKILEKAILHYDVSNLENMSLLQFLTNIGNLNYVQPDNYLYLAKEQSQRIKNNDKKLKLLIHSTFEVLSEELMLGSSGADLGDYLSLLVVFVFEENPMTSKNIIAEIATAEDILVDVIKNHNSWLSRRAAIVLLSFLDDIADSSLDVITLALKDVNFVVEGVNNCWRYFTSIYQSEKCRYKLFELLDSKSGNISITAAKILSEIAINPKCPNLIRKEIIQKLVFALRKQRLSIFNRKLIYLFEDSKGITFAGTAEHLFYDEILRITSITE